jgi:hypothetical protein
LNLWGLWFREDGEFCGDGKIGAALGARRGRVLQVLDGGTGGLLCGISTTEDTESRGKTDGKKERISPQS